MSHIKAALSSIFASLANLRIHTKFFLTMFAAILSASVLLSNVIYTHAKNILIDHTEEFTLEYLEQLSANMENRTVSFLNTTYTFMDNANVIRIMNSQMPDEDLFFPIKDRQTLYAVGEVNFNSKSYVSSFYIRKTSGHVFGWSRNNRVSLSQTMDTDTLLALTDDAAEKLMSSHHNTYWYSDNAGHYYLARNFLDPKNVSHSLGCIVFEINPELFQLVNHETRYISNENIILYNHNSTFLFADEKISPLISDFSDSASFSLYTGSGIETKVFDDCNYLLVHNQKKKARWGLFCFIPEKELLSDIGQISTYTLLMLLCSTILALILSYFVSKNISRNINTLEKNMRNIEQGDFKVRLQPKSKDEIGILCLKFNYMSDKIEELLKNIEEEYRTKQQLEMKVLKAQINPHFLYNSLGSIRSMARLKNEEEISQMVTALIELLRTSLGKSSEYQCVEEEIRYLRNYFILLQYRYEDYFDVEYDLDPDADSCIILNFLLQPLVENAIFHGLEFSSAPGHIQIRTQLKDDLLILSVTDNGIGMPQEYAEEILNRNTEKYALEYDGLNSIGISNIQQRIQLYYGQEYGLFFKTSPGMGTTVEVRIPAVFEKEVS